MKRTSDLFSFRMVGQLQRWFIREVNMPSTFTPGLLKVLSRSLTGPRPAWDSTCLNGRKPACAFMLYPTSAQRN